MTELLTSAQMRAIEAAAIASGRVTGLELMERAGRGVVEAVFAEWPELAAGSFRAVVLCGPGNNGGDGFVVARLLKQWGWAVEVFLYGDAEKLPPDALVNYERWRGMGDVGGLEDALSSRRIDCCSVDLVVDSVFGIGLARPMGPPLSAIFGLNDLCPDKGRAVSVDVPSGMDADSGRRIGEDGNVFFADLTVTFHSPKLGHVLGEGPELCSKLAVVDIGLNNLPPKGGAVAQPGEAPRRGGDEPVREARPLRDVLRDAVWQRSANKYTHGHALILSGAPGHCGAARLAARGALRVGAGLVTLGCPGDAVAENAAQLNAVMLREVGGAAALAGVLEDRRINALCLGPGMGVARAAGMLEAALGSRRRCVLDADALTALAHDAALFGRLHGACVLTPHAGEFARLFPDIAAKLAEPPVSGPAYSKVDATREAAKRAGCVVLYKGADTVIADPSGACSVSAAVYDRAAPWLATAGSGDVLAGFIAGLLARGFDPMQAAETAAWLHVECARSFGPGLIAEDLPEELPKVLRAVAS
ncbi:MAG: NAD(P)H-hydrate dehydratase [Rhodobacteraceae bacterium]|nr:NAD(P)H-hydrate dehydratase [Paracoccaceae bacterium]